MALNQKQSSVLKRVRALCIQGKVLEAYNYLHNVPEMTKQEQILAKKLHDRFLADEPKYRIQSKDKWVRAVVKTYYQYFTAVLTGRCSPDDGTNMLAAGLHQFAPGSDLDEMESNLGKRFASKGYQFLGGVTQPFYGPYIWKTTETVVCQVEIPSGTVNLPVHFMRDFLMLSWLEFASCGLVATGGWAKADGLYCVQERYKKALGTPEFEVSYLKHEAQHLVDLQLYPELTAKDLELRAKLVELIYYPTNGKLFDFIAEANHDKQNAHTYAAHVIVSELSKLLFQPDAIIEPSQWEAVPVPSIQEAARNLLDSNSKALMRNCGERNNDVK